MTNIADEIAQAIAKDPISFSVRFCQEFFQNELGALMQARSISLGEAAMILTDEYFQQHPLDRAVE